MEVDRTLRGGSDVRADWMARHGDTQNTKETRRAHEDLGPTSERVQVMDAPMEVCVPYRMRRSVVRAVARLDGGIVRNATLEKRWPVTAGKQVHGAS